MMRITDWPKEDRPREKLLKNGAVNLTDAELIAIFLKTGVRGKTALDIAKQLLKETGGLKKLLSMPKHLFMQNLGLGQVKYVTLQAALELGQRYLNSHLTPGEVLDNSKMTQKFVSERLRHKENEIFACVFMDTQLRLISFQELFMGTINEAQIYPRVIVRYGLQLNAAKIILAHNHPSGNPSPSLADREITTLIKQALGLVDIEVVDHIIVGNFINFSFAEAGLL